MDLFPTGSNGLTLLLCLFAATVVACKRQDTGPWEAPQHPRSEASPSAPRRTPDLNGCWDMSWRREQRHLQHVPMCIEQEGANIVVSIPDKNGHGFPGSDSMEGVYDGTTLVFTARSRLSADLVFRGTIVNGIIVGTAGAEVPWLAMRHFD